MLLIPNSHGEQDPARLHLEGGFATRDASSWFREYTSMR